MIGKLVQVDKYTIDSSSPVSNVILTGFDTDNAYFVTWRNVQCTTDNSAFRARVRIGGSIDTGTNYTRAFKTLKAYSTNSNDLANGQGEWFISQIGTPANEQANGWGYLYDFNSTTKKAFGFLNMSDWNSISKNSGNMGGIQYNGTGTARDGIQFYISAGTLDKGEFVLYKIV